MPLYRFWPLYLFLFQGCDRCADDPLSSDTVPQTQLLRASMALRGVRPSLAELDQVAQDPGAIADLVQDWLTEPAFGATVRDMHAEQLLLRSDLHELLPSIGAMDHRDVYSIHNAKSEGPLTLIEETVLAGRPYTEIVTSDTLRVNATGADLWGADYDPDGPEWQVYSPEDGRPAWGILSDGAIWARHVSNGNNYQRARANLVSSVLLCADFHTRDIPISDDIDLSDDAAVANAVLKNPSCVGCHQSLDPLSSFLWGFLPSAEQNDVTQINSASCTPLSEANLSGAINDIYRDTLESAICYPLEPWIGDITAEYDGDEYSFQELWYLLGLRAPGYFGLGEDLSSLGTYISEDPRFASCTVKRFYGFLSQSAPDEMPLELQGEMLDVFLDSGMDARELAKAIVLSDSFAEHGLLSTRPEQYIRLIEDLTGFRWMLNLDAAQGGCDGQGCIGEADLMGSDLFGFRSMAGGMDGYRVTTPTHTDTPTRQLVLARYASEAAGFTVREDFSGTPRLLTEVSASTTDEAEIRAQLSLLHQRILSEQVSADSDAVSETYALFEAALAASGEPTDAWAVVLTAMLQAPAVLFY